jgi:hypothetical protein
VYSFKNNIRYKYPKVYNVYAPSNIENEIIQALKNLQVSDDEIEKAIKNSDFLKNDKAS